MTSDERANAEGGIRFLLLIVGGIIVALVVFKHGAPERFDARFVVEGDRAKQIEVTGQRLDVLMVSIIEQCARDGYLPGTLRDVENLPEDHMYDAWGRFLRFSHGSKDGVSPPFAVPGGFMVWSDGPDGLSNTDDDVSPGQSYLNSLFDDKRSDEGS